MRLTGAWLLLVPAVAGVELGLHAWFAGRAPAFDRYAEVVPAIDALRQGGDLVVMAPVWAEPALRRAAGDDRMPLAHVARPDTVGVSHAIEVSMLGEHAEELEGWRESARREAAPFVVRRLENPWHRPTRYDFVSELFSAGTRVATEAGPCVVTMARPSAGGLGGHPTFRAKRHACPDGAFFNASVTVIADEAFRPRRCIWAHPPASGELSLRYRDVPLGDRIVGHGGLYWMIERERRGAPVEVVVAVEGAEIGRYLHADGDGWSTFDFSVGESAGSRGEVSFQVSSPDHRHRHFCFEARMQ